MNFKYYYVNSKLDNITFSDGRKITPTEIVVKRYVYNSVGLLDSMIFGYGSADKIKLEYIKSEIPTLKHFKLIYINSDNDNYNSVEILENSSPRNGETGLKMETFSFQSEAISIFTYDVVKKCFTKTRSDDGVVSSTITQCFDNNNRLIRESNKYFQNEGAMDDFEFTTSYKYDEHGVRTTIIDKDLKKCNYYYVSPNDSRYLKVEYFRDATKKEKISTDIYHYEPDGSYTISIVSNNGDGEVREFHNYSANNKVLKIKKTSNDFTIILNYEYDENWNLLSFSNRSSEEEEIVEGYNSSVYSYNRGLCTNKKTPDADYEELKNATYIYEFW